MIGHPAAKLRTARMPWWDLALAAVGTVVAVLVRLDLEPGRSFGAALGLLAALAGVWIVAGRRAIARESGDERLGGAFCAALTAALGGLCAISPSAAFLQVFAYPYAWSFTERRWRILAANGAIAAAVVAGTAASFGWSARGWAQGLPTGLISLTFSLVMGLWIDSIANAARERGRLQAQLAGANEELAAMHRQMGAAAERERFAHEIHDTLAQTLTAVVMLAERGRDQVEQSDDAAPREVRQTLGLVERSARQALAETRSLIERGRGIEIGDGGLAPRLSRACDRLREETGMQVDFAAAPPEGSGPGGGVRLDRAGEVVLLRCAQELLANVRRHARATHVRVRLGRDGAAAVLQVADDGAGFPDGVAAAAARGYGLRGIESRLALSHGQLQVRTGVGGTVATVRLPEVSAP